MAGPGAGAGGRKPTRAGSRRYNERKRNHPPPYGNGLAVRLIVREAFWEAAPLQDAPAIPAEDPDAKESLQLVDWNRLEEMLTWFAAGCQKDDTANLCFHHSLHQNHRAQIHRLADQIGLDSFSQGFGSQRHCSLYAKGKAPAKAIIDDITQKRAKLLFILAKQEGLNASKDECGEMLAEDKLTPELKTLWETKGKEQLQIVELNQSASRGNLEALKEGIARNPELVRSGKAEVVSTLTPLNCAAAQGHVACLEALIEAGAPLEAEDGFGQTALQASRRFEQMDTEGVLLRAGAVDQAESEDSMPSQSDLAEFFRALPRGQKQSPAIGKLGLPDPEEQGVGFNQPVRSSFENLSQIPREEDANGTGEEEIDSAANGVSNIQLARRRSSGQTRQSSAGSGLVNPLTNAMVFGKAITRRQPGDLTLNSSLNLDMRRDYEGSPDLRGNPNAATRGSRGAAAMALGRRIMESAQHQQNTARRNTSTRLPDEEESLARKAGNEKNGQQSEFTRQPSQTLQEVLNPLKQPLSLTTARMSGRLMGRRTQNSKQRIEAWMESAPEEHSAHGKLTHSVSNPAFYEQELDPPAKADSAPENQSEARGDPNFDIKGPVEEDLYNDIDAMQSRPPTEKHMKE